MSENEVFVGQRGGIVQKMKKVMFFLKQRLVGLKNTRTFVLKEKERWLHTRSLLGKEMDIARVFI